jgi:hypothetical protein
LQFRSREGVGKLVHLADRKHAIPFDGGASDLALVDGV